ncbi:hypothetical protein T440DRAFT_471969 [Plenodomus tracheiphilus IPT5]|uniref:Uncharacterized protein n=1 Tax=Plenodomus tracheiphilus IPT5 TaxID=1408161 RepID=A0A6A7AW29_9PLEO|nr:hypothetical protein T440DRAFT_471969 [Plenodomus tracheiphilus IPT5]
MTGIQIARAVKPQFSTATTAVQRRNSERRSLCRARRMNAGRTLPVMWTKWRASAAPQPGSSLSADWPRRRVAAVRCFPAAQNFA